MLTLYQYYRSSASYRVRLALNLKGIEYKTQSVNLRAGEQNHPPFLNLNRQGLVPVLVLPDNQVITQSGAILRYLETAYSAVPLLPNSAIITSRVQAFCDIIACDVHPICNLRVLTYLEQEFSADIATKGTWHQHWIQAGLSVLENMIEPGPYCFGDKLSMAEIYLIPQIYNAKRFDVDMTTYPKLSLIEERCNSLEAFQAARPENQPDTPAIN